MLIVRIAVIVFVAILAIAAMTSSVQTANVSITTTPTTSSSLTSKTASSSTTSSSNLVSSSTTASSSSVATSQSLNQTQYLAWKNQWLGYAKIAWQFFKPGVGVSPTTGLMYAFPNYHEFTDWDLASYIEAVLAAEKLGLITQNGTWGADYRLKLVLNFLETRVLTNTSIPYQFYDSDTGGIAPDVGPVVGNPTDEGKLLIAFYNMRIAHPELAQSIENAMSRVNYKHLALTPGFASVSEYSQYSGIGFRLWNFTIPNFPNLENVTPGMIVPEPVLSAILDNVSNDYLNKLGMSLYLAHYALYNRTGLLLALGEGQYLPYGGDQSPYVYESIEVPNGTSYKMVTDTGVVFSNAYPETFTKIALAFYAIYRTGYAQLLANNVTSTLATSTGYYDGFISGTGQIVRLITDNTNSMVVEAAAYAILAQ